MGPDFTTPVAPGLVVILILCFGYRVNNYWPKPPPKALILVVDDDEAVVRLLQRILTDAGFSVLTAQDGEEAVKLLYPGISLVIADINMPNMGGLELLKVLRAQNPTVPFLLLSGMPLDFSLAMAAHLGEADFFPKPVTPIALIDKVEDMLKLLED